MPRQFFACQKCGYFGEPVEGVEEDEETGIEFVGCDSCGTRHEVTTRLEESGRYAFTVVRVLPDAD